MTSRRPNILMIVSDQEQAVSVLPSAMRRPGITSLLDRGTHFSQHHVVALPCGPSRSALYTGLHTEHTGLHGNPGVGRTAGMSAEIPTIGTMLRAQGYHTAYKGKWHVSALDPVTPFVGSAVDALEQYGFADYNPDGDPVGVGWEGFREDPVIAADAAAWLHRDRGSRPEGRPWFLAVNFVNPHDVMFFDATGRMNEHGGAGAPRMPAPRHEPYGGAWEEELPLSFDAPHHDRPGAHTALVKRIESFLGRIPLEDRDAWLRLRHYYYNCLLDLDRHVGVVLEALEESGQADDTVVVYTSDHGEAAGAHGMREKPISVYREVISVPLVIAHPDGRQRDVPEATSAVDIAPTILSLAGVDEQERGQRYPQLTGHDLSRAVLDAQATTARDGALVSMRQPSGIARPVDPNVRTNLRGVVRNGWKLARYSRAEDFAVADVDDVLGAGVDIEVYDMERDPHELINLAARPEHSEQVRGLAERLVELVREEVDAVPGGLGREH